MSDQQQPQEPAVPGSEMFDPTRAIQYCIQAIEQAAIRSAAAKDTREMGEAAKAALAFSQTVTMLDPRRLQGGDDPDARRAASPPAIRDGDRDGQIGERK